MVDAAGHEGSLGPRAMLRYRLAALRMRGIALWGQVRRLGAWLEAEALPAARQLGLDIARFDVEKASIISAAPASGAPQHALPHCDALCQFLRSVGVERLELDPRLEGNQISDALTLLYAEQDRLSALGRRARPNAVCGHLRADGVAFACTRTRLEDGKLIIAYSYCRTSFSRLVQWFEGRHRVFSDHRALFHAAPVYSLIPVAIVLAMLAAYALTDNWWLLAPVAAAGAAVLATATYLFFMVVGSVEYDNEERSHRLQQAHAGLQRYARRIHNDLAQARTVQEKLLPDPADMPLPGRITWARSFVPETEVGGDYFDAAEIGDGKAAMLLVDVSGHGMAAAMITAIIKTAFQTWVDEGWPLRDFVLRTNRSLCRLIPDGSFAAVIAAVYEADSGELSYVNCGHSPEPIFVPADQRQPIAALDGRGAILLGIEEDLAVSPHVRTLQAGDRILLVTDGLVEATCTEGRMFGRSRLDERIAAGRGEDLQTQVASLVKDVEDFSNGAPQSDDRTVLAMEVLG